MITAGPAAEGGPRLPSQSDRCLPRTCRLPAATGEAGAQKNEAQSYANNGAAVGLRRGRGTPRRRSPGRRKLSRSRRWPRAKRVATVALPPGLRRIQKEGARGHLRPNGSPLESMARLFGGTDQDHPDQEGRKRGVCSPILRSTRGGGPAHAAGADADRRRPARDGGGSRGDFKFLSGRARRLPPNRWGDRRLRASCSRVYQTPPSAVLGEGARGPYGPVTRPRTDYKIPLIEQRHQLLSTKKRILDARKKPPAQEVNCIAYDQKGSDWWSTRCGVYSDQDVALKFYIQGDRRRTSSVRQGANCSSLSCSKLGAAPVLGEGTLTPVCVDPARSNLIGCGGVSEQASALTPRRSLSSVSPSSMCCVFAGAGRHDGGQNSRGGLPAAECRPRRQQEAAP